MTSCRVSPKITSRAYTFTLHDPTPQESLRLALPIDGITYMVYQLELAPTTARPHLQGYFCTGASIRCVAAKRLLGYDRAHVEPRWWTHESARDYCKDPKKRAPGARVVELGQEPAGSGCRSDLDALRADIRSGSSELQLFERHTASYFRYQRAIVRARGLYQRRRDPSIDPAVHVYCGPAGCGKSKRAYERYSRGDAYWASVNESGKIWWAGYTGESCIILDDFAGEMPFKYFLRMVDRYPLVVCAKGESLQLLASEWIITSNTHPDSWWHWTHPDGTPRLHKPALQRRVSKILLWRSLGGGPGWVVSEVGW